ncbi:putative RDD family membrane protein YckC [Allocatelliglobosispora scoriae]|uniref:Putative RDD family membrane protein YckC n=1 Tax=Allocatelliglobosispora scoriae TaxID=643052 RepID=A0A841BVC8_9ACTN|nr:RDD family protein [Allocatelliglobosispora scoriae]MBB5870720.1 putative RDD family membrane protein YckC [Allocatelliglobosispora scoriae]
MTAQSSGSVPPGWYPDPAEPSVTRYWDGEGWRVETPAEPEPPVVVAPPVPAAYQGPQAQAPYSHIGPPGSVKRPVNWPADWPFPPPGRVTPFGRSLATPGRRIAARLLDVAILTVITVALNAWFVVLWWREALPWFNTMTAEAEAGRSPWEVEQPDRMVWLLYAMLLVTTLAWFAYEVPSTANTGRTLGKRIMRIQVIPIEGEGQLTMGRAFRRWNPMGTSFLLFSCCGPFAFVIPVLDVIFIATDRYLHQALHDRSAQTYVVNDPPRVPDSKKEELQP